MVYTTHIRLSPPISRNHQHIPDVKWRDPSGGDTGQSTRQTIVDWIDRGGEARVHGNPFDVKVVVVRDTPPYIRTVANGTRTDNLLNLPKF